MKKSRIIKHYEIDSTYYTVERKLLGLFWISVFNNYGLGGMSFPCRYNNLESAKADLQKYLDYKSRKYHKEEVL